MSQSQLKLLLVEDNPGDARLLREAIADAGSGRFELVHVAKLVDAGARLAGGSFDLILLDLSLPDAQGLETLIRTRTLAPALPIVVMTGLDDENLALRAVQDGAEDYLVKGQVDGAGVVRCIRYAVERYKRRAPAGGGSPAARLIGVIGAKGGVGTTTVALNVAWSLAERGKSVIAAELRPDLGSFAMQLGYAPVENLAALTSLDAKEINPPAVEHRLSGFPYGMRVLFGPQKLDEFRPIAFDQAEALVRSLAGLASHLVVDLPPGPSPAAQAALAHAHYVAVVVEREPVSIRAAKLTLDMLHAWGVSSKLTGLVVVTRTVLPSPPQFSEISSQLGCPVIGAVPPAPEDCSYAYQQGTPLVAARPMSIASGSLIEMAEKLTAEAVPAMMVL